ncbi:unnamed protein product, partial [Rotaria magnacalcarata]
VSKIPNVGSLSIDNTNESSVPLIVVNEIISSEETSANASVNHILSIILNFKPKTNVEFCYE